MTPPRKVLVAADAGIAVRSLRDIADAIGATFGAAVLILTETDLSPEFFDLKTGLAGELFQKFTNYQVRLALIIPHPERFGERFNELAREHRSHNHIRIVPHQDELADWLQ